MALGAQEDGANGPTSRRIGNRCCIVGFLSERHSSPRRIGYRSSELDLHRSRATSTARRRISIGHKLVFRECSALSAAGSATISASSGFTAVGLRVRGSSATVAAQSNFQAAGLLVAVGAATAAAVSSFTASAGQVYYGAALIEAVSDVSANGRRKWRPESNATTSWAAESAANNPWTSQTNASTAWQEAA